MSEVALYSLSLSLSDLTPPVLFLSRSSSLWHLHAHTLTLTLSHIHYFLSLSLHSPPTTTALHFLASTLNRILYPSS